MRIKDKYINKFLEIGTTEADLVREYLRCKDYKKLAKEHGLNTNHLKGILRRAGVLEVNKRKEVENKLMEIGMNERDFL